MARLTNAWILQNAPESFESFADTCITCHRAFSVKRDTYRFSFSNTLFVSVGNVPMAQCGCQTPLPAFVVEPIQMLTDKIKDVISSLTPQAVAAINCILSGHDVAKVLDSAYSMHNPAGGGNVAV